MKALDFVATVADNLGWGDVRDIEDASNDEVRKIIRATNLVLRSLQAEQNWQDLRSSATIVTQPPYEEDDVPCAVNTGETSMILDITGDISEYANCLLRISGYNSVYRIVAVGAPTFITLDRPWVETSIAENVSVVLSRDIYHLPADYDRIVSRYLRNTANNSKIDLVGEDEIEYSRVNVSQGALIGQPQKVTIYGRSPSGFRTIIFDRAPDQRYVFDFEYQRNHPAIEHNEQEIMFPDRYLLYIVDQVTSRLNRDVENSQKAAQEAQDALMEKVRQGSNPDSGNARMKLTPYTGRRYY